MPTENNLRTSMRDQFDKTKLSSRASFGWFLLFATNRISIGDTGCPLSFADLRKYPLVAN